MGTPMEPQWLATCEISQSFRAIELRWRSGRLVLQHSGRNHGNCTGNHPKSSVFPLPKTNPFREKNSNLESCTDSLLEFMGKSPRNW